jgi:hypothetical protein
MVSHHSEWTAYILGALLVLLIKWGKFVYYAALKDNKHIHDATLEWFFEKTFDNITSWITTIAAVWVVGSIYIDRAISVTGLSDMPVVNSFAFLLGSLMEMTAPAIVKWTLSKLPIPTSITGG